MARTKIVGIDKVFGQVEKLFSNALEREDFLGKIRDFATLRIQAETRKGKDLSRNGKPQPALSEGTVAIRERIKSGDWFMMPPEGDPFFRFNFSNLTLSGQMLESLKGYLRTRLKAIEIRVEGNRAPVKIYSSRTGREIQFKNRSDFRTNAALANDLADRGRTFLGLDQKGVERIRRMVLDQLRREIKRSKFIA